MTRNRGLSTGGGGGGASNFWICKTCSKKFTKISDQLMECEYCENHYCSPCLGMTDTEYEHHVLCPQKVTGPSIFYNIYWKTSIKRGKTV